MSEGKLIIADNFKQLHRNNLFVISGVVFATNFNFVIDSSCDIDTAIEAELNTIGEQKINFTKTGDHQITMQAASDEVFPIALKAYRMHFARDRFKKLELVTDNRNLF